MERYWVAFLYGCRTFEKPGFRQKRNLEKYNHLFARRTRFFKFWRHFLVTFLMLVPFKSIDTNELLKKTVPQNMGYWQTNQKLKKKVSCFKVALG